MPRIVDDETRVISLQTQFLIQLVEAKTIPNNFNTGAEFGTDEPSVFAERSNLKMTGFDMIRKLSAKLYQKTGLTPNDVQV